MYAVKILENNQYELLSIKDEDMSAGGFFFFYYNIEFFQVLCILSWKKLQINPSPSASHGKL